ncbi:hypothetical protein [Lamprobacter modestohalophilus]|uniref:hypothetical protein n=1 Tax=Lamprobacter modestohalophilus TaxID=1064514 RepID=UPI0019080659|nr:hypothetical protein [Lamprobacter modestohalophilus]
MSNKLVLSSLILSTALIASTTLAGTAVINGKVTRTLIHNDGGFGGCMAQLSVDPQAALPACGGRWVTFSCTGDFTDQVSAYRSMDQAQLALATDKNVMVIIDDTRRHNGFCFATRIDVMR